MSAPTRILVIADGDPRDGTTNSGVARGVMNALDESGFAGWIVIEQDVLPGADVALADFRTQRTTDQKTNRDFLRQWA